MKGQPIVDAPSFESNHSGIETIVFDGDIGGRFTFESNHSGIETEVVRARTLLLCSI